jgi:hypothetical protein
MTEQSFIDFLSALGEEFCQALSSTDTEDQPVPQDAYEVWLRAFGSAPSPERLSLLSDLQIEQLRVACEEYFDGRTVSIEQVRKVIARTLVRWPAERRN